MIAEIKLVQGLRITAGNRYQEIVIFRHVTSDLASQNLTQRFHLMIQPPDVLDLFNGLQKIAISCSKYGPTPLDISQRICEYTKASRGNCNESRREAL